MLNLEARGGLLLLAHLGAVVPARGCQHDNPMTFASHAEAKVELDDFLADIADEIAAGRRAPDAGYDASEFRIVALADPPEA